MLRHVAPGLALAIGACSGARAPETVAETFMVSLHEGRCDGLGDSLAGRSRGVYGPALEAVCRQEVLTEKGGRQLASMRLLDKQEDGGRATLNLQPVYADGSTGEAQRFAMVREDGAWRIDVLATGRGRLVGRFGPHTSSTGNVAANTQ